MIREPFTSFHKHYDRFMTKYVDYRGWVHYLERIFRRFGCSPSSILDLACGTGIPTLLLAERGYRLTGVDRSPEMLAELETKRGNLPVKTIRADIRDFTVPVPHDVAICLYDSMNYLLTEDDLVRCFGCVRRAIVPAGLFVFDMNTEFGLAEYWGSRSTIREVGGVYSVWENSYDTETRVSTLHLTYWEQPEPGKVGQKFEEIHQERAYRIDEVRRCLEGAGFGESHFFQHGSFLPVAQFTTRMMVVARPGTD